MIRICLEYFERIAGIFGGKGKNVFGGQTDGEWPKYIKHYYSNCLRQQINIKYSPRMTAEGRDKQRKQKGIKAYFILGSWKSARFIRKIILFTYVIKERRNENLFCRHRINNF